MKAIKTVRLHRHEESDWGTFGILKIDSQCFCVTLEPQDRLNEKDVSCIPAQQYICKKIISPKFGETFEVTGVPGRDDILFHPGNTIHDTLGCIILARKFGVLKDKRAVLNSGETFKQFMEYMLPDDMFHLTIKEDY